MKSIKHFIVTRFNLRPAGPLACKQLDVAWLTDRFDLFDRFCYPTVKGQTEQDFRWLVLFDEDTPGPIRSRIRDRQVWPNFTPVFLPAGMEHVARKVVADQLDGKIPDTLITTRLDNDDSICRTFVEEIRRHADLTARTVLQFPTGYVWSGDKIYLDRQYNNPFTTLIEPLGGEAGATFTTIYHGAHTEVHKLADVISVSDDPAWVQVVHGGNLVNRARGVRHSMGELASRFDIEHAGPLARENSAEMALDKVYTRIKSFNLKLARSAWHWTKARMRTARVERMPLSK